MNDLLDGAPDGNAGQVLEAADSQWCCKQQEGKRVWANTTESEGANLMAPKLTGYSQAMQNGSTF